MLDVFLGGRRIGHIVSEESTRVVSFILDDAYAEDFERPVLGQQFEERRHHRVFRQSAHPGQLPTFFANLLPEGALEEMIRAQFATEDATSTLALLGEDLPGAVAVRSGTSAPELPDGAKVFNEPPTACTDSPLELRFSLAGVQLKFSAVRHADSRFTLPFTGKGGRWILKFGSAVYPGLPENEFWTMRWAARCGLSMPQNQLIPASTIDSLEPRFVALGQNVFAIERYDRLADGSRVHQEDFAQVRGVYPDKKYEGASYEALARFIGDQCGAEDRDEFLRRVLFLLLSGNTDGHLKNWSLVYPHGRNARLSPAYDFVCVRQYLPSNQMALPLAKEKSPERIDWSHIRRVDKYLRGLGHDVDFEGLSRVFVMRCMDEWASHRQDVEANYRDTVESHLNRLPLVRARA